MIGRGALAVAFAAVLAAPTLAQEATRAQAIGADQLSPTLSGAVPATPQISADAPALSTAPAQPVDRTLPEAPEPGSVSQPRPETQLTGERGRTDAGVQLTSAAPDAGPAPSAAARLAGRNTTVDRPNGPDRCDPRADARPAPGAAPVCARVIETRAGDFPAPDTEPLSAEQRLMVAQRPLTPMTRDLGSATRRLADGNVDESNAGLAVASLALGQPAPGRDDEEEPVADTSVTDAIVAGVLSAIGQQPTP